MCYYICLQAVINYGATWYGYPFDMEWLCTHMSTNYLTNVPDHIENKFEKLLGSLFGVVVPSRQLYFKEPALS